MRLSNFYAWPLSGTQHLSWIILLSTGHLLGQSNAASTTEINLGFVAIDHYTDPDARADPWLRSCPDQNLSIRDCVRLMISNDQDMLSSTFNSNNYRRQGAVGVRFFYFLNDVPKGQVRSGFGSTPLILTDEAPSTGMGCALDPNNPVELSAPQINPTNHDEVASAGASHYVLSSKWCENLIAFFEDLRKAGIQRVTPTPATGEQSAITVSNIVSRDPRYTLKFVPWQPYGRIYDPTPNSQVDGNLDGVQEIEDYTNAKANTVNFRGWKSFYVIMRGVLGAIRAVNSKYGDFTLGDFDLDNEFVIHITPLRFRNAYDVGLTWAPIIEPSKNIPFQERKEWDEDQQVQ